MSSFIEEFKVDSPQVTYSEEHIIAEYVHSMTRVDGGRVSILPKKLVFKTERRTPRTGVMLVGWGGNNGSTFTAGIIANRLKTSWNTKEGLRKANYVGSLTQSSTVRLGEDDLGNTVYIPFKKMLPMVEPNDLVIGGWDINGCNLAQCMVRSQV